LQKEFYLSFGSKQEKFDEKINLIKQMPKHE